MHGQGCQTLLGHADRAAAVVGVYMADAGIMFHSGGVGGGGPGRGGGGGGYLGMLRLQPTVGFSLVPPWVLPQACDAPPPHTTPHHATTPHPLPPTSTLTSPPNLALQ